MILLLPSLFATFASLSLRTVAFVFHLEFSRFVTCRDGYPNSRAITEERTDDSVHTVVARVLEETIPTIILPILKANSIEIALRSCNQRSLVLGGYPESNPTMQQTWRLL